MSDIHRIRCGNVNCYIVENGSNGILVDTGKREFADQVIGQCRVHHVKLIVLTHAHFDHAENTARISDALGIPIGMNERDRNLIPSNANQALSAETLLGKAVLSASLRAFSVRAMPEFTPDILLKDGDSLTNYGISADIIALPGHTDGSIGLDVDHAHLIVGDALMNMLYPTVSMLYHNKKEMLESAAKIGRLGVRKLYFGHGGPVPNRQWGQ